MTDHLESIGYFFFTTTRITMMTTTAPTPARKSIVESRGLDFLFNNLGKLPDAFLDHLFKNEMLFYVYEEAELVGVLNISPNDYDSIANFGVSSKHRGKGYGGQLMLYGMKLLKEQGNENSGLRVHVNNKVARQLYESLGFTQESIKRTLIWRKE